MSNNRYRLQPSALSGSGARLSNCPGVDSRCSLSADALVALCVTIRPQTPSDTLRHPQTPSDTPGHPRTPPDTPGHPRTPPDTPGHPRTPPDTPGHPRTPPDTPGPPIRPHTPPYAPIRPHTPPYAPIRPHNAPVTPPYAPIRPHAPSCALMRPHAPSYAHGYLGVAGILRSSTTSGIILKCRRSGLSGLCPERRFGRLWKGRISAFRFCFRVQTVPADSVRQFGAQSLYWIGQSLPAFFSVSGAFRELNTHWVTQWCGLSLPSH